MECLISQTNDGVTCSLSRSQSPRPSISPRQPDVPFIAVEPRSAESIRIIIDDVDSSDVKKATPGTTTRYVARLQRDPSKSGHGFTGFGLTLSAGRCDSDGHLTTVISRVEPHGSADRAGLCRGDTVLCWDGVKVSRSVKLCCFLFFCLFVYLFVSPFHIFMKINYWIIHKVNQVTNIAIAVEIVSQIDSVSPGLLYMRKVAHLFATFLHTFRRF